MLGAPELIVVLIIVLVLFGGAKLPKLAKSLGEAQREFKKGSDDGAAPSTAEDTVTPTPPAAVAPPAAVIPPAAAPPAAVIPPPAAAPPAVTPTAATDEAPPAI